MKGQRNVTVNIYVYRRLPLTNLFAQLLLSPVLRVDTWNPLEESKKIKEEDDTSDER